MREDQRRRAERLLDARMAAHADAKSFDKLMRALART
jgi:hypothetical protein